jgi:acyl carrier protein
MAEAGCDVLERARRVIVRQCRVPAPSITPETRIDEDLCPGSMEAEELILALEDEFRVRIPDDIFTGSVTLGDLLHCIKRELTARSKAVSPTG